MPIETVISILFLQQKKKNIKLLTRVGTAEHAKVDSVCQKPPKLGQEAFKGNVVNKSHLHTNPESLLFKRYQPYKKAFFS